MTITARDPRADFLQAVPIFGSLSPEMRAAIAERARWVRVAAGEWLLRQDEPGDSLYVVRSGRLEILLERPREETVRVLTRGAVVGELAVMTGTPRSASVRARRDSELLRLERSEFVSLMAEQPDFAVALAIALGHQLQLSRGLPLPADALPATVAVLALGGGCNTDAFADALGAALGAWKQVACLRHDDSAESDYPELLDRCERDHDVVLLVLDPQKAPEAWIEFCLRQADRTLALYGPDGADPQIARNERIRGCDLIGVGGHPAGGAVQALMDLVEARTHRPLAAAASFSDGVEEIARRLAGRAIGIVLSGGGARGFAHIGVLDELRAAGVQLDRVAGCSMGAFVGALFAAGMPAREMVACCRREFVERSPLSDYAVPTVSLIRGTRAESMLKRIFGSRMIEWLPCDFFCVTCDLITGELVVHRRGPIYEFVGASMCLPGIFPPVRREGRLLVDGGVLNNLPVEPMIATAEGPVIASDVTGQFDASETDPRPRRRRPAVGSHAVSLRAAWKRVRCRR